MKVSIKYTNIGSSPAIDTYVEQKIGELDEFINIAADGASHGGETVEAFVEVGRTTTHHQKGNVFRAEVQIKMPGDSAVRAEAVQPELHLAIDKVKDELQGQLKRYKTKQRSKDIRGARMLKELFNMSPLARLGRRKK